MSTPLQTLRGFRDFLPQEALKRQLRRSFSVYVAPELVEAIVANPEIAALAEAQGLTRSEAAILKVMAAHAPGLIAIGNAPTALLSVIKHCAQNPGNFQGVIIGAPVGFVNAAESKEILAAQEVPHIVALGRKGGSPVAAAIVNALIRLAAEGS